MRELLSETVSPSVPFAGSTSSIGDLPVGYELVLSVEDFVVRHGTDHPLFLTINHYLRTLGEPLITNCVDEVYSLAQWRGAEAARRHGRTFHLQTVVTKNVGAQP